MKTNRVRLMTGLVVMVMFAATLAAGVVRAQAQRQPPPTVAAPEQGFVPVTDLPTQEQLPAAPLVMGAYAVAWLAVFGYLWSIWRRLSRVEREIASVSRRIESGARR
jgi:CcmD family protein